MCHAINIPNVDRDNRIGSAFNELFSVISSTESQTSNDLVWDLQNATFFHPFYLAPLAIYKQSCGRNIACNGIHPRVAGYLDLVHFENPLCIEEYGLEEILEPYTRRSFIPVCKFELNRNNIDSLQSILQKVISLQSNLEGRMISPLSYFLGELIDNMNEHSQARYGYLFSQYRRSKGCIDLVLADDGITVYGSYVRTNRYLDEIDGNEATAMRLATEGRSTKNRPGAETRGYGISSSKQMLVEGLHGSFFMLSGGAFHRHEGSSNDFVRLPDEISWDGTIILMRIPVNAPLGFDYYEYIQ